MLIDYLLWAGCIYVSIQVLLLLELSEESFPLEGGAALASLELADMEAAEDNGPGED